MEYRIVKHEEHYQVHCGDTEVMDEPDEWQLQAWLMVRGYSSEEAFNTIDKINAQGAAAIQVPPPRHPKR